VQLIVANSSLLYSQHIDDTISLKYTFAHVKYSSELRLIQGGRVIDKCAHNYKIDSKINTITQINQKHPTMKTDVVYLKNINRDIVYLIGTNAQDNFDVIDASQPDDLWFHVKDMPSCHVVAKIPDDISDRKQILSIAKRGGILCKQHSKYASVQNLEIIYTRIKNVEKTSIPGSVNTTSTKSVKV